MGKGFALVLVLVFLTTSCIIAAKPVSEASVVGNSWVEMAPMHVARGGLDLAVVNGKIYAIGGSTQSFGGIPGMGSGITGDVVGTNEQYDPATNTWTIKSPMPTPRAEFGIAVFQNKIYCIGGITNDGSTGVNEVYDPTTDTWTTKAPMPGGGDVQANVVNGKIYVLSGDSYGTANQIYDPVTDSWAEKTPESDATFRWASVALDGKIYALGGIDPLASGASTNEVYNATADAWNSGDSPPLTIYGGAAAATTGALSPIRIYFMGLGTESPFVNGVYDPEQDTWVTGASLPSGLTNFGIAVVDDELYVIGGDSNTLYPTIAGSNAADWTPSAVNEQYVPIGYGTPDPSYVLEHVPPKITLQSPLNQTYKESNVSLVFTVDKAVDWVGYSLDGEQNVTISNTSSLTNSMITNVTVANVTSGLHSITVYANDTFGNMGVSENIAFRVKLPGISGPFPTASVATVSGVSVIVAVACLLVYFKKRKQVKLDGSE
jgi:hypothetical protein